MAKRVLNCVDLFAGAGGFSLAAKEAGLRVEAAIELNPKACLTYRRNLVSTNGTRLYEANILEFEPNYLTKNHFATGKACDIVLGGPPCQGFSVHRINGAGVNDPRNKLIHRYFDFVDELRPKVFLMENVPGILWERHKDFLAEFYRMGQQSGYILHDPVTLDARDYGIPQRRKRVFALLASIDVERVYTRSASVLGLLRLRPERRAASARAYWASVVLWSFEAFAFVVVATRTFRPISRDIHLRGWIVGFAPAVCAATRCAPPRIPATAGFASRSRCP